MDIIYTRSFTHLTHLAVLFVRWFTFWCVLFPFPFPIRYIAQLAQVESNTFLSWCGHNMIVIIFFFAGVDGDWPGLSHSSSMVMNVNFVVLLILTHQHRMLMKLANKSELFDEEEKNNIRWWSYEMMDKFKDNLFFRCKFLVQRAIRLYLMSVSHGIKQQQEHLKQTINESIKQMLFVVNNSIKWKKYWPALRGHQKREYHLCPDQLK